MNLLVWQLIDSAFPSGGFAHSAGLEAACSMGTSPTAPACARLRGRRSRSADAARCRSSTAAHRRPEDLAELDGCADVFLSNPVANRASRAQGRALLTRVARSFPHARLAAHRTSVLESTRLAGHYAPLFGAHLQRCSDVTSSTRSARSCSSRRAA